MRFRAVAVIIGLLALPLSAGAQANLAQLLRQWQADGTAAGNQGDYYDNRDRGHSELNLAPFPQLTKLFYTDEQIKANKDLAFQMTIIPHVTFGNASMAAPAESGGSMPRISSGICRFPPSAALLATTLMFTTASFKDSCTARKARDKSWAGATVSTCGAGVGRPGAAWATATRPDSIVPK